MGQFDFKAALTDRVIRDGGPDPKKFTGPDVPDIWHPKPLKHPRYALPEKARMTIAAGFHCRDGVILCADTELNYGDSIKVTGSKMQYLVRPKEAFVAVTGSGHWNYVQMAFQKIQERWMAAQIEDMDGPKLKDLVEDIVLEIYERHIAFAPDPKPGFSLLLGLKTRESTVLIVSNETAVAFNYNFEISGIGTTFGLYLADVVQWRREGSTYTAKEAAILAAYILWVAKQYTPGCGGASEVMALTRSGIFEIRNLALLESRFYTWDTVLRPLLFLPMFDTDVSGSAFSEKANRFSDLLQQIRHEWSREPIEFRSITDPYPPPNFVSR